MKCIIYGGYTKSFVTFAPYKLSPLTASNAALAIPIELEIKNTNDKLNPKAFNKDDLLYRLQSRIQLIAHSIPYY